MVASAAWLVARSRRRVIGSGTSCQHSDGGRQPHGKHDVVGREGRRGVKWEGARESQSLRRRGVDHGSQVTDAVTDKNSAPKVGKVREQ